MHLPEGVVDLDNDSFQVSLLSIAEEETHRVENVVHDPGGGHQCHLPDIHAATGSFHDGFEFFSQGLITGGKVVPVVESDGPDPVVPEAHHLLVEVVDLIQVETVEIYRVGELVLDRARAGVHDPAGVDPRSHRETPKSRPIRTADLTASSWKP